MNKVSRPIAIMLDISMAIAFLFAIFLFYKFVTTDHSKDWGVTFLIVAQIPLYYALLGGINADKYK